MLTKYQLYYSSDKHCFFSKAMEVYSTTHLGKKTVAIKCKCDNRKSKKLYGSREDVARENERTEIYYFTNVCEICKRNVHLLNVS